MQDLMLLLVQCVSAGAALGITVLVLSYGLYLVVKYLRNIFSS